MDKKQKNGNQMKRNIIIAAIAMLLAAGLVALLVLLPKPEDAPDPSATVEPSLEPVQTHYLINEQFTKLDSVTVYDADGNKVHTITSAMGDNGMEYSISPDREGWNYDAEAFRSTAVNASTISSLSLVAENPSDLSQYGLDKPLWRIVAKFAEGARSYEILVGAPTALNNSYYCSNGDGNVYAVGAYAIGTLTRSEMEYRTYEFFPDYYDKDALEVNTNGEITYIRMLDESTGFDMIVRKVEDGEFEEPPTAMYMESPIRSFVSEDQAENNLINGIVLIQVNGIYIDDPTPEQLSECGFDTPKEVWLKNDSGREVHYTIGTTVGSNGYVMVEGLDTILTAEGIYTSLFELKYTDIMFKMLLTDNIKDVETVEFNLPDGARRQLKVSYTEPTDSNPAGIILGKLDGVDVNSTNTARLYAALLNLTVYEAYPEGSVTLPSSPALSAAVTRKDGRIHTLELYAINERRYAVKRDGQELCFYVHRDAVNTLINAFGCIDRGEDIPRV